MTLEPNSAMDHEDQKRDAPKASAPKLAEAGTGAPLSRLVDAAPRPPLGATGGQGRSEPDADLNADLALVRRIEALAFRAWPAATSFYDGSWLVRLTAGHPSRRLNSINPLDRMDAAGIEGRVARLSHRFSAYDREPTFRRTPLAPPALFDWLDEREWETEGETRVLVADAARLPTDEALDRVPLGDVGLFVEAALAVRPRDMRYKSGLTEVLTAIHPPKGMFTLHENGAPVATALCVHDGDFAGLFEVAVREDRRGRGLGRAVTLAAMRWARLRGATRFWCQVEADNRPASALYAAMGLEERYRYHYRTAPRAGGGTERIEELI